MFKNYFIKFDFEKKNQTNLFLNKNYLPDKFLRDKYVDSLCNMQIIHKILF